jgi:hypothetical protein
MQHHALVQIAHSHLVHVAVLDGASTQLARSALPLLGYGLELVLRVLIQWRAA